LCNGQRIDEEQSPWYGLCTPNLNLDGRFLRGGTFHQLGAMEASAIQDHFHKIYDPGHDHGGKGEGHIHQSQPHNHIADEHSHQDSGHTHVDTGHEHQAAPHNHSTAGHMHTSPPHTHTTQPHSHLLERTVDKHNRSFRGGDDSDHTLKHAYGQRWINGTQNTTVNVNPQTVTIAAAHARVNPATVTIGQAKAKISISRAQLAAATVTIKDANVDVAAAHARIPVGPSGLEVRGAVPLDDAAGVVNEDETRPVNCRVVFIIKVVKSFKSDVHQLQAPNTTF
jgi:hypothetical protein